MGIQKRKFAIFVLIGILIVGGGMIGYKFYYQDRNEAGIDTQQKVEEKEGSKAEIEIAESKVISAEMNPTEENIKAAQQVVDSLSESEEKRKLLDRVTLVKEEFDTNLKLKEEARLAALEEEINQAKIALGIDQSPTETDVLEILHDMTHQKVRSEEKWGFVHITEVNLLAVKEVLQENLDFNQKIDMLSIVMDWLNNDFSNIVAEHNLIWKMKDGSVGKAYGILSPSEEAALVKEQFGVQ